MNFEEYESWIPTHAHEHIERATALAEKLAKKNPKQSKEELFEIALKAVNAANVLNAFS